MGICSPPKSKIYWTTRKFQKDAEDATNASHKEWDLIMDIADNNYIKCMIRVSYFKNRKTNL